jgi:FkbM family methyltransferase
MTFISYAQNFEDVMLWRALKHIEVGFYIDVGAADPTEGSVTRAFYDRGWNGINIEPEPGYAASLRASRPRDINLELAVGAHEGKTVIHRIAGTGLSTFDKNIAAKHEKAGHPSPQPTEVEVATIEGIWRQYNLNIVHFFKVDAEGAERDVILGANLSECRPWIIIVEATYPFSPERCSRHFQKLIKDSGYKLRWFDGLNEWYIAEEHDVSLRAIFKVPPNFFDDFVMANYLDEAGRADAAERELERIASALHSTEESLDLARQQIEQSRAERLAAEARTQLAEERLFEEERRLEDLQTELNFMHSSPSWRLVTSLRKLRSKITKLY